MRYREEPVDKVLNEETWHIFDTTCSPKNPGDTKRTGNAHLYVGAYWKPKGMNEKWSAFYCADMDQYGMIREDYETREAARKALIDLYEVPREGVFV